ncbi:MAG: hypothetical protein EOS27_12085 [Mesorhizobium sp.]|nr:MAG: hypothetical protein EOS27_12085 [Mesorhizobium sp.]
MKSPARPFMGALALMGMLSPALGASMEALQGAWTMPGTDCAATFEKQGGKIRFRDRIASTTTGIIVSGSKVLGPQATCTAQSIHTGKDHVSAYLNCADAIMFSGVSVSFRIIDQDTFERFDSQFPEVSVRYHRCKL